MRSLASVKTPDRPLGLRDELVAMLGRFDILSPVTFSFDGEPAIDARSAQPAPGYGAATAQGEEALVKAIGATLYERCYTRRDGPSPRAAPRPPSRDSEFARRLAAANRGRERWDKGWIIHQFGPNGQAFVRKGDRERIAVPGAFIFDGAPGRAAEIGASVSLRVISETFDAQPGYYYAFGEALDELADSMILTRLYFHCAAESAATLIGDLTTALNDFQTPFQLKTPIDPEHYRRADAAVLYVASRYFPIVARLVDEARKNLALEPSTPLFTRTLWPGVAAAVEPGTGESFGQHRCRLVAEGVVDAWREGKQEARARRSAVEARFGAAGLDLSRPWLGPSGVDPFVTPDPPRLP